MEQWMNRRMKHAKRAQKYKEIELTLDWLIAEDYFRLTGFWMKTIFFKSNICYMFGIT